MDLTKRAYYIHLTAFILFAGLFYYFYKLTVFELAILIAVIFITWAFIAINKLQNAILVTYILISTLSVYVLSDNLRALIAFTLGINICAYYLYLFELKNQDIEIEAYNGKVLRFYEISIINSIVLAGIVFYSAIEKFRGYNKLPNSIELTIATIVLSILAIYFVIEFFNSISEKIRDNFKTQKAIIVTITISIIYTGISYLFFKEIGMETILIPLVAGLLVGVIQVFVKTKSLLTDINDVVLIAIIPYQIAGLLGISIAFLSAYLYTLLISRSFSIKLQNEQLNIHKFLPIIFLLAAAEIRENEGQITRFNLVNGFQIGWIFLSAVILTNLMKYIDKIKQTLLDNEILNTFALVVSTFTILAFTIIIRFGHDEAMIAFLLVIGLYLFFTNFIGTKGKITLQYYFVLGSVLGSLAFLVLTKI